jgi:hypothetical protein
VSLKIEPERGKRVGKPAPPRPRANSGAGVKTIGETTLMRKPVAMLLAMLSAAGSAYGQEPQVGRYQMSVVPASQAQTFPEALLLDTATGQTWMLYHETGQAIQWIPLRFSAGKDRPATTLPPPPDAVGVSR